MTLARITDTIIAISFGCTVAWAGTACYILYCNY